MFPPLSRTAARTARTASLSALQRPSVNFSQAHSSVGGSLRRNSSENSQSISAFSRASAAMGLSPLREADIDAPVMAPHSLNITDL